MPSLIYRIGLVGEQDLKRSIGSIERRFVQHSARMNREFGGGRRGPSKATADRSVREAKQQTRAIVRVQQMRVREQERAARAVAAAEKRSLSEQKRINDAKVREEDRLNTRLRRIRTRSRRRRVREARAERASEARFRQSTLRSVGRGVSSGGRVVGAVGGGLIGVGGAMLARDAVSHEKTKRAAAAGLANQAFGVPGETRSRKRIRSDVMALASREGERTGLGSEGAISALREFAAKSGTVAGGEKLLPFLMDLANATDANVSDVGRAGGQILASVRQADPTGDLDTQLKQTAELLRAMGGQAKVGQIELRDMAGQVGKVMSSVASFDGDIVDLGKKMSALGQMALAGGAGDVGEATTALMRIASDLVKHEGKVGALRGTDGKRLSVFTSDDKNQLRDPIQVIADVVQATRGDQTKLKKIFGERSAKAANTFSIPFTKSFNAARKGGATKDDASAIARREMMTQFNSILGAGLSTGEVTESSAFRAGETDRRLSASMERINNALGPKLLPVLERFVGVLEKNTDKIADFASKVGKVAELFAENPFSGLGLLVSGFILKELAFAGIGKAIAGAASGGGVGDLGGSKRGGNLGVAGALATAAYFGISSLNSGGETEAKQRAAIASKKREALLGNIDSLGGSERSAAISSALPALERDRKQLMQRKRNAAELQGVGAFDLLNRIAGRSYSDPEYAAASADKTPEAFAKLSEQLKATEDTINRLTQEMNSLGTTMSSTPNRSGEPSNGTQPR